jgi:NAD(P)-dependent dehydrogenase (short-subunit alcohol dehydrogenase family)
MPSKYVNKLEGRLVVILGGTSGLGFAVAEACVEYGAVVVVSSRSQSNIDKAVSKLKEAYPNAGDRVRGHPCNLNQKDCEPDLVKLFDFATANGANKVDHVVNTAGEAGGLSKSFDGATAESLLDHHRERAVGAVLLAKVAHKYMNRASSSSYTMTSGVLVYRPMAGMSSGLASASAEGLARGLAVDMAPVRCNVVSPGAIMTPLLEGFMNNMGGVDAARPFFEKGTLVNQIGTPEDCAEAYLCSIKNNFMTGVVLHAEGGFLLKSG